MSKSQVKIEIDGNLINIEDFLSDTNKTYYAEPIKDGEIDGLRPIAGEWWQRGQLFIHGDSEPEAVINCGKTTVDIEAIKKYFEDMVRKEIGNER